MSELVKSIIKKCPPDIPDFICIKSVDVFFPYAEIGIDCLVRDFSDLSLVFEIVLSLSKLNVCNINEICEIMGLSFNIVKEIVVDLVALDYVTASEETIKITGKGKKALEEKQSVQIKKYYLNNVAVDLITGKILSSDSLANEYVSRYNVCLKENITVDLSYLERNISDIKTLFEAEQRSFNDQFRKSTKELYRLVNIHHQNLRYIKKKLYIYKSIDSDELQFILDGETDGEYHDALFDQLKSQSVPSLESFFERDRQFKKKAAEFTLNKEYLSRANKLRKELDGSTFTMVSDLFVGKRYTLFDNEYKSYFEHDKEIQYKQLIIYSNRIKSILSTSLFTEINRISESKQVFIIYDKNERGAKAFIDKCISGDGKGIHIIESSDIDRSVICFDDSLMIEMNEYTLSTLNDIVSFKAPVINCDSNDISDFANNDLKGLGILLPDSIITKKVSGKSFKKK